jgi:hypothetical protein
MLSCRRIILATPSSKSYTPAPRPLFAWKCCVASHLIWHSREHTRTELGPPKRSSNALLPRKRCPLSLGTCLPTYRLSAPTADTDALYFGYTLASSSLRHSTDLCTTPWLTGLGTLPRLGMELVACEPVSRVPIPPSSKRCVCNLRSGSFLVS